jgi:Sec-independent protein translocase protein TatA
MENKSPETTKALYDFLEAFKKSVTLQAEVIQALDKHTERKDDDDQTVERDKRTG